MLPCNEALKFAEFLIYQYSYIFCQISDLFFVDDIGFFSRIFTLVFLRVVFFIFCAVGRVFVVFTVIFFQYELKRSMSVGGQYFFSSEISVGREGQVILPVGLSDYECFWRCSKYFTGDIVSDCCWWISATLNFDCFEFEFTDGCCIDCSLGAYFKDSFDFLLLPRTTTSKVLTLIKCCSIRSLIEADNHL